MTYTTLRQGSTGEEVRKLQESLGFTGKDVDGIYGQKTAQAVRDYQTANSLKVDGIAGNETLGHLYSSAQNQVQTEAQSPSLPGGQTAPFTQGGLEVPSAESEAVAQAKALLDEQLGKKPAAYESEWRQQADGLLGEFMNRDKFSYDVNEDVLYQQLQDQFVQSGRMAMMDTMGQAAALTGGYGSSYGQMVGQQAYQSHLQQLTDKIPELYQLARENYDAEGQALLEKFALISEMDDREYSRYMDELNAWMTERDYLTGRLDTAKGYEYQAKQDAIAQDQWERNFAEQQRQYDESMGLTKEQWEWEKAHSGSSGGGGGEVVTEVSKIDYKSIGFESYMDMIDDLETTKKTGGKEALAGKLNRWALGGYITSEQVDDLYYELTKDEEEGGGEAIPQDSPLPAWYSSLPKVNNPFVPKAPW